VRESSKATMDFTIDNMDPHRSFDAEANENINAHRYDRP